MKLPIAQAAQRMKISRPSLCAVLNGSGAVTADMALRFARQAGGRPELYLHIQDAHDLWHGSQRPAKVLKQIESAEAA